MTQPSYRIERATRSSTIGLAVLGLGLIGLLLLPLTGDRATMRLIVEIAYFLALAQMWNLLAGYAGLLSVGQHAFIGFGGYMLFALVAHAGFSPIYSLPIAGLLSGLISIPVAILMFRLSGPYFAIGTWVVAEVFKLAFFEVPALGGGSGMSLPLQAVRDIAPSAQGRELIIYISALAIAVASVVAVYALLRSRYGLALTAIRDSERASASVGVDTFRLKLGVFVAVAAFTGMIGALIFLQKLRISPVAAFDVMEWSAAIIFIVVIGGIGRIEGPFVGIAIFFLLRETTSDFGAWYLILLGLLAIAIMLFARQGIWGLIADRYRINVFPVERQVHLDDHRQRQASSTSLTPTSEKH
ncbi:branched-chain amino acid ABC transporter permease [Roseobacter sp. YSTF-M11]|uniref:Branched-chain amino acid ABC transporter permease n=1 Tax=Roseobacter insulae TaxID=2859783 RepID=A0A9X1K1A7_9RHOB|nr:branched-chain amino acid ABC transporter permease [Roseobacter insulae]MBW4706332.1 branched-chain amino acid ABC transporter permease [Roseobacter insulae]